MIANVNADLEKTMGVEPEANYRNREGYGECARAYSTEEIIAEMFRYHPPTIDSLPKYAAINQAAKNLAEVILQNCPGSADRSAAIRLVRDARMTANAAIALNGLSL